MVDFTVYDCKVSIFLHHLFWAFYLYCLDITLISMADSERGAPL